MGFKGSNPVIKKVRFTCFMEFFRLVDSYFQLSSHVETKRFHILQMPIKLIVMNFSN